MHTTLWNGNLRPQADWLSSLSAAAAAAAVCISCYLHRAKKIMFLAASDCPRDYFTWRGRGNNSFYLGHAKPLYGNGTTTTSTTTDQWRWRWPMTSPLRQGSSPWCCRPPSACSCQVVESWGCTARRCCCPSWWRTPGQRQCRRRPWTTTPSGRGCRSGSIPTAATCPPARRSTSAASTSEVRPLSAESL